MRALAAAAACLAVGLALWAASASAEPVGLIEEFDVGGYALDLAAGPDGNLWFTFDRDFNSPGGAAIGRITPQGKVTKFTSGLAAGSAPADIVLGPDGNLWFADRGRMPAIGRITPRGAIAEFSTGLSSKSELGQIVSGPDGNLWFSDDGALAIGRVTPGGEITEFTAGLPSNTSLGGIVPGPDGNLWFEDAAAAIGRIEPGGAIVEFGDASHSRLGAVGGPVAGPDGNLWIINPGPRIGIARITPLGAVSVFTAGLNPEHDLVGPLVAGADGTLWFAARGQAARPTGGKRPAFGDATAIGRVAPGGEIVEFDKCLHHGPPYTGPDSLVAAPDGNVWFTSTTTRSLPNVGSPPAIGRITPAGEITEFRAGMSYASTPGGIVAGPDGALWFTDRELGKIGRIAPPSAPPNTFLMRAARRAKRNGITRVPVVVPGPGTLTVEQVGLLSFRNRLTRIPGTPKATATAVSCGSPSIRVALKGVARKRLRRYGSINLKAKVTFTPTGGSPHSEFATVAVVRARKR